MYHSNLEDWEIVVLANEMKSGVDIHTRTAKRYGITRQQAKRLNLIWMYGQQGDITWRT